MLLLLNGCTITKIEIGDKKFSTYRFLDWTQIGKINVSYPPAGGTNDIEIVINDYYADREKALKDLPPIVEAVAEGVVKGMVDSVAPTP